jgi:hypothetical protein
MSQRARHPVSVPDDAMKIKSKNIVWVTNKKWKNT